MKLFFTDGDKEQVTKIKVMADYGACTWDHDGAAFNFDSIGIPQSLVSKFTEWEEWYEMNLSAPEKFDVAAFDKRGLKLAGELKQYVGEDVQVTYFSEARLEEIDVAFVL